MSGKNLVLHTERCRSIDHTSIFLLPTINHCVILVMCMIYKIYTFQSEANHFLYGLGKGPQQ